MENEEKLVFSRYRKIASGLLTFITIIAFFWDYMALIPIVILFIVGSLGTAVLPVVTNIITLSILIAIIMDIRALYLYIKYILESFNKKKRVRSILLAVILIAVVIFFRVEDSIMNTKFVTLTYYILILTCISIIPIVRTILDLVGIRKKYKEQKETKKNSIIKAVVLIILIIVTQCFMLLYSGILAKGLVEEIKNSNYSELFAVKEKKKSKPVTSTSIVSTPHISEIQRNTNIIFSPSSELKEEWISSIYKSGEKGEQNYTFKNLMKLHNNNKKLSYMKVCFALNENCTNFVPVEDEEENYNKIDSYLISSNMMEITLKPDVKLENK